jgi:hypothetical protein
MVRPSGPLVNDLRPETALLILCSRVDLDPQDRTKRDALIAGLGPGTGRLFRDAVREGVAPLLHRHLGADVRVSPELRSALRRVYYAGVSRQFRMQSVLGSLLRDARDAGLNVIVMKGAYWAESLYPEPGLRPFLDADLLVPPRDGPALRRILERAGFIVEGDPRPYGGEGRERAAWLVSPVYKKYGISVEVHLNPLGLHMPLRAPEVFWKAARETILSGAPAWVMPWEYEICYAAIHAQQHSYERLSWLVDIAEMARRTPIDWRSAAGLAEQEGLVASVSWALRLVDVLWPDTLPRGTAEAFALRLWEKGVLKSFWPVSAVAARRIVPPAPFYLPSLFALARRRRMAEACRVLPTIIFPPRSWVSHYYPARRGRGVWGHYAWRVAAPWVFLFKRIFLRVE